MHYRLPAGTAWDALAAHHEKSCNVHMRDLFASEPRRAENLSIQAGKLYLDYSKNRITTETLALLNNIAYEADLKAAIKDLLSGELVNVTENRAALHTLLRANSNSYGTESNISEAVQNELRRASMLYDRLVAGHVLGFGNKPIDTIVNIGIGGSDLGPRLVTDALGYDSTNDLNVHFVANVDPTEIEQTLLDCRAETTLFIISSKSYTTLETRKNAESAELWLREHGCPSERIPDHFLAATANIEAAIRAGIKRDNIYQFWDWVGGRYSVWSAAGLAALLAIGPERFFSFLHGASQMDQHFHDMPLESNMPVLLALIGIWYINFFNSSSHAIIPYDQRLRLLPDYLCQLVMESNGKSTTTSGDPVEWNTAPVTWGNVGTNAQHSFFQALHQGSQLIPIDLLLPLQNSQDINGQQAALYASCLAQSRSLMIGSEADGNQSASNHAFYPGNRPSNTIVYQELTAEVLGTLLALYEHKTYVQAVLWRINPFDQWGVELGKQITKSLLQSISNAEEYPDVDSSTMGLLQRYRSVSG